jgi:hypothetical protein
LGRVVKGGNKWKFTTTDGTDEEFNPWNKRLRPIPVTLPKTPGNDRTNLAALQFAREGPEWAGLAVGVQLLAGFSRERIQFFGRHTVFLRGVNGG